MKNTCVMRFLHFIFLASIVQLSLQQCSSACSACINTTCIVCSPNYLLYNNNCITSCPAQYYQMSSVAGSSCQIRTNVYFNSSLITSSSNYEVAVVFNNTDDSSQFNFSGLVNVFVDGNNHTTYTVYKNASNTYTVVFGNLTIDSVLDRQIFIDTTALNNNPATAYTVLVNASQTNLTIPGLAGVGSVPQLVGKILGIVIHGCYGLTILMAAIQNVKSGGTNPNLLIVSHYSFLFQSFMLLNVQYAPNLIEFYQMMPGCLWNRGQIFQKAFLAESYPIADSLGTSALQYTNYMSTPTFLGTYDIFGVILLITFVCWIIVRIIFKLKEAKKTQNVRLKGILDFLEWNFLISVIGGTVPILGPAIFIEFYFLWLSDVFSYISLVASLLFGIMLILDFLFLAIATTNKESYSFKKIASKAPVILEGLSNTPIGIKGLLIVYMRSLIVSSILITVAPYPTIQTSVIFIISIILTSLIVSKSIFKGNSLLFLSRWNEILLVFQLSWFIILSFQDSYAFLVPAEEILIAWVIIGTVILQAILLMMFQAFEMCKMSKSRPIIHLRDEEVAAFEGSLKKSKSSYYEANAINLGQGDGAGLIVIKAANALDDSINQQLIGSNVGGLGNHDISLAKLDLAKDMNNIFEMEQEAQNLQKNNQSEDEFSTPGKIDVKKTFVTSTPETKDSKIYKDPLLNELASTKKKQNQEKTIEIPEELIHRKDGKNTPSLQELKWSDQNNTEKEKNDLKRNRLLENDSNDEFPEFPNNDSLIKNPDDDKNSDDLLLELSVRPKRQKK